MSNKSIKILAIESSCDETSIAVVEDGKNVLSNAIYTQIEIHKAFGPSRSNSGFAVSTILVRFFRGWPPGKLSSVFLPIKTT